MYWIKFLKNHKLYSLAQEETEILSSFKSHIKFITRSVQISSVQFSHSVVSDSLRSHGLQHTRFPVHHEIPEFTQTHLHWVCDGIQPSHPLTSPSPPALNLSQHQGLFKWVSSSHQVAKVLEFQLQHQYF